jgi:hypothetical protein
VSLLVLGSFLATYPVLRVSPRERRLRAGMDAAAALLALAQTLPKPRDEAD